jgi:DNA primase
MAFDLDGIRRSVTISDVAQRYGVRLQPDGREFKACCPFHEESTPSFTIYPAKRGGQYFFCFGCDAEGDVIDFVQAIKGVNLPTACEILGGTKDAPDNRAPVRLDNVSVYDGITPLDTDAHPFAVGEWTKLYNPKRAAWGKVNPSHVHEYRDAAGKLVGLVLRRTLGDGGKETPQVRWVKLRDGSSAWARVPLPQPRPMYGLGSIGKASQVTVVEGEKCRDAFAAAMRRPAVSWAGGGKAVHLTDWSPLTGRDVILWPDADVPGRQAMERLADILVEVGAKSIKLMQVPAR